MVAASSRYTLRRHYNVFDLGFGGDYDRLHHFRAAPLVGGRIEYRRFGHHTVKLLLTLHVMEGKQIGV